MTESPQTKCVTLDSNLEVVGLRVKNGKIELRFANEHKWYVQRSANRTLIISPREEE